MDFWDEMKKTFTMKTFLLRPSTKRFLYKISIRGSRNFSASSSYWRSGRVQTPVVSAIQSLKAVTFVKTPGLWPQNSFPYETTPTRSLPSTKEPPVSPSHDSRLLDPAHSCRASSGLKEANSLSHLAKSSVFTCTVVSFRLTSVTFLRCHETSRSFVPTAGGDVAPLAGRVALATVWLNTTGFDVFNALRSLLALVKYPGWVTT